MAHQVTISMIQATSMGLLFSEEQELLEVVGDQAEDGEKLKEEGEGEIEAEDVAEIMAQVVAQVVALVDVVVYKAEVAEDMLAVDILSGMSLT